MRSSYSYVQSLEVQAEAYSARIPLPVPMVAKIPLVQSRVGNVEAYSAQITLPMLVGAKIPIVQSRAVQAEASSAQIPLPVPVIYNVSIVSNVPRRFTQGLLALSGKRPFTFIHYIN
jgi:hypothetical protein